MSGPRIVVDTNVLFSGLRSRLGKSFRLLEAVGRTRFQIAVSVPLLMEYEDVLHRDLGMSSDDANHLLAYWCSVAHCQKIFFLWRPCLRDPKDDMVLELAVAARAKFIVTFNLKDFAGVDRFGIEAVTPGALLDRLEPDHGDPEP